MSWWSSAFGGVGQPTATLLAVLDDYAGRLDNVGGHLILAGMPPDAVDSYRTPLGADGRDVAVIAAEDRLGASVHIAVAAGRAWIEASVARQTDGEAKPGPDDDSGRRGEQLEA